MNERGLALLLLLAKALACNETENSDWLFFANGASYLNLPIDNWSRNNGQMTTWHQLLLRRDPQIGDTSVLVDLVDMTYAVGDGSAAWGIASDCSGSPSNGEMSINLTGTPFSYQAQYATAEGYLSFGSVQCENSQVCTATCGGICGFCGLGIVGTTEAELQVEDQCAFSLGIQAWATTTSQTTFTETSSTTVTLSSTTTTYLGNTTTSTSSRTSSSTTLSLTSTSTSITQSVTTSTTQTISTTTQVDGYYFYRFTPTNVAESSGTACCCAHAVAELYFRNCGDDVETASAMTSNPGGDAQSMPAYAFDGQIATKWRDSNRQPLVVEWQRLTPVDSYSYLTAADCPDNDPLSFELHGSQDGIYWELLDSRNLSAAPPVDWRPAQTEWFTFKNCTPTTTVTSLTTSSLTSTSSSGTSTSTATSSSVSRTETMTATETSTTSPTGSFVLLLTYGACAALQLYPILTQEACEEAARQLSLPDTSVETTGQANRPEGCYLFEEEELWMGINPASQGKGAETSGPGENQTRYPICSSVQSADRVSTSGSQGAAWVHEALAWLTLALALEL